MLSVFGDESADATGQRVFAVAGIIGDEDRWKWLEDRWLICTDGIPFHATDCDSDQKDYAGREHSDNKNLYKILTQLLAQSGLGGWGFAIDLRAQRRVFPHAPDIAYFKCFLEVLKAMRNCAAYNKRLSDSHSTDEKTVSTMLGFYMEYLPQIHNGRITYLHKLPLNVQMTIQDYRWPTYLHARQ